jgi:hypothetical protein
VKRNALVESVRRVNNLEKANTTHLQKFADMSRKNEAMEKVGHPSLMYFLDRT